MGPCLSTRQEEFQLYQRKEGETTLHHAELMEFMERHTELWAMLAVNINVDADTCKDIAVRTALSLVTPTVGDVPTDLDNVGMTASQFKHFHTTYVEDPRGSLDFFQKTVFAAFDKDNNGLLDPAELDIFCGIFYAPDSIFAGDARLPVDKEEFKELLGARFDENKDGMLSFSEIQEVISGKANIWRDTDAEG